MPHAALSAEFLNALKTRRNGRDFVAESLVASRSALLIVDMQNVFVDPAGALGVSTASAVVPAINRLADGFRRCGSTVAWVRTTFSDSGRGRWQRYFDGLAPGDGGEALRAPVAAAFLGRTEAADAGERGFHAHAPPPDSAAAQVSTVSSAAPPRTIQPERVTASRS